jgi:hypothetical protein
MAFVLAMATAPALATATAMVMAVTGVRKIDAGSN